jgi:hypothetical protein
MFYIRNNFLKIKIYYLYIYIYFKKNTLNYNCNAGGQTSIRHWWLLDINKLPILLPRHAPRASHGWNRSRARSLLDVEVFLSIWSCFYFQTLGHGNIASMLICQQLDLLFLFFILLKKTKQKKRPANPCLINLISPRGRA